MPRATPSECNDVPPERLQCCQTKALDFASLRRPSGGDGIHCARTGRNSQSIVLDGPVRRARPSWQIVCIPRHRRTTEERQLATFRDAPGKEESRCALER
jgi:hypothetical protein